MHVPKLLAKGSSWTERPRWGVDTVKEVPGGKVDGLDDRLARRVTRICGGFGIVPGRTSQPAVVVVEGKPQ